MSQETDILRRVRCLRDCRRGAWPRWRPGCGGARCRRGRPSSTRATRRRALYLIAAGRVKVHQATASGDEVILDVLGPGDFFGDMSLLDGQPRSADVSTLDSR